MSLFPTTIITQSRLLGATPNQPQGRWSDANLIVYVDMAQKHLVQELLFPESRMVAVSVANQQYYPIQDSHRIYRVYLDGQICVEIPGNLDTLEGRQTGQYDSSGQGAQVAGSDGPIGGTEAQPQWVVQTPVTYPYLSNYGPPAPMTQPSFIGAQPRFYRRSGGLGFVPAPANICTITVDGVFVPPDITVANYQGTPMIVPIYFQDALTWYVVTMMKFSDDTQSTQDQRNFAEGKYQEHLKKLRTTIRQYKFDDGASLVRTDRWRYQYGRRTNGTWGNGNP